MDRGAEQGDPVGGIEAASALLGALEGAESELGGLGVAFFDTWYLDDGQLFCLVDDADMVLKSQCEG